MKIDVFNIEEFIELNELKEISSPVLFQRGDVPDPNGLISNDIFGVGLRTRKNTFAYIKLNGHFFNPHIYKALRRLWRNIEEVINGDFYYSLDENGIITEDRENGRTGIESIYKDWSKIQWERNTTQSIRNERIDLLTKTPKNEIFMDDQIVIPAFYRDVSAGGSSETVEINNLYSRLIRMASMLGQRDMFDFTIHSTYYSMQSTLVEIYDYFKTKLEKKNGMIRKFLMGKNVDYSTRSVISAPLYKADRPEDIESDFRHIGVPISQCCSLCYPFVHAYIKRWFENEFIINQETKMSDKGDKPVKVKNPEIYFSDDYIKKMINRYIRDPEYRFTPILVPMDDGSWGKIGFTGIRYDSADDETINAETNTISNRPMTVTDLLYIAACDAVKDKHAIVTRYPVSDAYSIFFGEIRVTSTLQTEVVKVGETVYQYYPKIDLNLPKEEIATKFKETVIFSSSYLTGIGGDYDGDQVTLKIAWSQEANKEIHDTIRKPSYFIKANGDNIRDIGKEGLQTFYVLTKDPDKKSKVVPAEEVQRFLDIPPNKYTFSLFVDTFGYRDMDREHKITKAKYNTNDIVELAPNQYLNKEKTKTTLGRIFFNKLITEDCKLLPFFGFVNIELKKKAFSHLEDIVSDIVASGKYSTDLMVSYINHREWIGFQWYAVICSSFTARTIKMPPEVKKRKDELFKKYAKEIENGDIEIATKIEDELVSMTEKILDDDPGMDLFKSGSKVNTGNNLKNIILTRGPVLNPNTGKYEIINHSLMEGMEKEKFTAHSNSDTIGSYFKAVGTADSGYLSKQLSAATQTEMIDDDGTDCGTTKTITIEATDKIKSDLIGRNVKTSSGFETITSDNFSKYNGKTIHIFSPLYCHHDKICRKCAGTYSNKFIGLDTNKVATKLTDLNMKKYHDNSIHLTKHKPDTLMMANKKNNVFGVNKEEIILNDSYIEFYIPEYYFDASYKFGEDLGDMYTVLGVFNVGVFTGGKLSYIDTFNVPGNVTINVYEVEKRIVDLPGAPKTPCRVVKYYNKNIITKDYIVQDSANCQVFLRSIIYGKLPPNIPYSDSILIWKRNQEMNGVNFGVPMIILEVILRVLYRDKNNIGQTFSKVIGKPGSKATEHDYIMASIRQVCQYASTFSALTFEDIDSMITTSLNRKREKRAELDTPVEDLFKL